MKRTPILAASLLLLACKREQDVQSPDAPTPEPEGLAALPRPEPASIAADEVVLVEQLRIEGPESWRFAPNQPFAAGRLDEGCGVWQLGSGDFLGIVGPEQAAALGLDPCEAWRPLEPIELVGDVGNVSLGHPDGQRKLQIAGDRFELSGERPIVGKATKGRRYRAAAFSPDGQRLALFVGAERGPLEVEVWNLGRGRIELAVDVEPESDALTKQFFLRWTNDALVAVAKVEAVPCDPATEDCTYADYGRWPDDHIVKVWREVGGKLEVPEPGERDEYASYYGDPRVESVFLDPDGRWLFSLNESMEPRTGTSFSIAELPLRAGQGRSGLSWWAEDLEAPEREAVPAVELREWVDTAGATFLAVEEPDMGYDGYGWSMVQWHELSILALPDRPVALQLTEGVIYEGQANAEQGWRIGMAAPRRVVADFDTCANPDNYAEGEEVPCTHFRALPDDCKAIDASWTVEGEILVACSDRWLLAQAPELAAPIDLAAARELAKGTSEPRADVWGPAGLALWTFGEGLRLFDAKGQLVATHASVIGLIPARFDEEIDRALVREREGVRVVELGSGTLGPLLAWTGEVEHAAFAADGRLALAGGGKLAVFAPKVAAPLVERHAGKLAGLGFRQDGAILYVGLERALPELALDPSTLEGVAAAQLDRVAFARIAAAELDPSWRWAVEEDGTIVRTLDGQAVVVRNEAAVMSESGWLWGDQAYLGGPHLRIGANPLSAVYEVDQLSAHLARPTLVEDFFAGKPLPRPRVSTPPTEREEPQG